MLYMLCVSYLCSGFFLNIFFALDPLFPYVCKTNSTLAFVKIARIRKKIWNLKNRALYLQKMMTGPLRKGNLHGAFSLIGECSTFFAGCVLPEVVVLILIQWLSAMELIT